MRRVTPCRKRRVGRLGLVATALAAAAPLALPGCAGAIAAPAPIEEVIVVGRQPGPPLWRVYDGPNVLWIFPLVSPLPRDIVWDSDRVAGVLAKSVEVLGRPDVDLSVAPRVRLNPLNLFRGMRLARRLTRNPDGSSLEGVLPPALYARFAALRERYAIDDRKLDRTRPLLAGTELLRRVQREEGLVAGDAVSRQLDRLIRKRRGIRRTEIEVDARLEGSFAALAGRLERLMKSISPEQELACFESQLARAEQDIEAMKARANAWAQGHVAQFRGIVLPGGTEDVCVRLLLDSSETETIEDLRRRRDALWLENAVRALADNPNTFAVLDIDELLREDGLLARLRRRGYRVEAP